MLIEHVQTPPRATSLLAVQLAAKHCEAQEVQVSLIISVYNFPDWKLIFSSCQDIREIEKVKAL